MKKRSLFQRGLVKICTGTGTANNKQEIESPAFIYGSSGLAVTRRDATGPYDVVTHMRSGLKMAGYCDNQKQARLFCIALVSLVQDWNTIDSDSVPAGLGASVKLLKRCVERSPDNWRLEYIKAKLVGESKEKEQANI
jgi:hypothetical protein